MFESAELGHAIAKEEYVKQVPELRQALLEAQLQVVERARFPVSILIGGVDGAGKGETLNTLLEWLDPRHVRTHALAFPTDEERQRPRFWRFWQALPPKGQIAAFIGSWYTVPILYRVYGKIGRNEFERELEEIVKFERLLSDEGGLLLKMWFHISRKQQKKRLTALEKNPKTSWRVTGTDWKHFSMYERFREVSEEALRVTSMADAPWNVIEGTDARYRNLTAGKLLLEALKSRLAQDRPKPREVRAPPTLPAIDGVHVLKSLDLTKAMPKETYKKELAGLERKLNLLTRHKKYDKISVVAVFEGSDAAGKGGAIRRITGALDARQYTVIPIAAPTQEERAQPYLWRFWRHIPKKARITIFDRSWYGRVLVERVEGFCSEADWKRAYEEIVDFEDQLTRSGIVVVKYWLQVSKEEQLARFEARQAIGFKRHKITDEDWRNREKWEAYEHAATDMIDRTSTTAAPWNLVEANDKYYARIKVVRILTERMEGALDRA